MIDPWVEICSSGQEEKALWFTGEACAYQCLPSIVLNNRRHIGIVQSVAGGVQEIQQMPNRS